MKYRIAIPSYRRAATIVKKTAKTLERYNVEPGIVDVFINSQEAGELEAYKKALGGSMYTQGFRIIPGVPNLGPQRNFIERYYEEGSCIVMMDDDVDKVCQKRGGKLVEVESLGPVIARGFDACKRFGKKAWGINAAPNPFFMKQGEVKVGLHFVCGVFFGLIADHHQFMQRKTNHAEDYEYSIRSHIRNGGVVRVQDVTAIADFLKEPGGMQSVRSPAYVMQQMKRLEKMFPDHCKAYIKKSTGLADMRLRDRTGSG